MAAENIEKAADYIEDKNGEGILEKVASAIDDAKDDVKDAVEDALGKKETPEEKLAEAMEDLGEATNKLGAAAAEAVGMDKKDDE